MKLYVFLKNGFEEIEALTVVDYLRRAEVEVELISFEEDLIVIGSHNISVIADKLADEIEITKETSIYLPGGLLQMQTLKEDQRALTYIEKANKLGSFLIAICASTVVLEEAGVIKDKIVTSYPGFELDLKSIKEYSEELVVRDRNIITSRGPQTADDLAFYLVELFKGEDKKLQLMDDTLFNL